MEVILLESFDRLGQIGDVVKVKNGFARNYLIPQKKALRANKENKEKFQKIKDELILKNKKIVDQSKEILKKIENKEIIFIRNASDNGQLYGSVSPKDISNYFNEKKIDIKPSNINLHSSIKKIGIYDLNVKLHAEVGCNLKLNVATSEENAKKQKEENENTKSEKNINTKEQKENKTKVSSTEKKLENETTKKTKEVKKVEESTEDKIIEKDLEEKNTEKLGSSELSSKSSVEENNMKDAKTEKAKSDSVEDKKDTKT